MKINTVDSIFEIGRRKNQEDYIYPLQNTATLESRIFIVCDGVGGENKGEIASKIVSESIGKILINLKRDIINSDINEALKIVQINFKKYIDQYPNAQNMSTTLTMAVINKENIIVTWCGDSKIYHIRGNKILWKSRDHSLVQHLLDIGEINEQEAITHPQKNIIVKSISLNNNQNDCDYHILNDIKENDYLLLASDGIFEQIDDENLINILNHKNENKTELIYKKCEGSTNDNYSMYLLKIGKNQITKQKKIIVAILATLLVIFSFIYLVLYKKESNTKINIKTEEVTNSNKIDIPIFKNNELKKTNINRINLQQNTNKKTTNNKERQEVEKKENTFYEKSNLKKNKSETKKDSIGLINNDSIKNTIKNAD